MPDAHDTVKQPVTPSRTDALASCEPKPSPEIVTLQAAVVAPLRSATKLTAGAETKATHAWMLAARSPATQSLSKSPRHGTSKQKGASRTLWRC